MNIECNNLTAEYRPNIKEQLYKLKNYLHKQSATGKRVYPLFNFSYTFYQGVNIILGSNSAGKSTLLRLLTGNLPPKAGTIRFAGQLISLLELRSLISYLPQTFDLYPEFTAEEMLEYIALLKGITPHGARTSAIEQALSATTLRPAARQKIKTYSRGMKQRLGIAQTLLSNTPILLLDEPTASLDPDERNKFRRLITNLGQSRLVLFSSSILTDIVCADTAVVLHEGHCLFAGTPAALAAHAKPTVLTPMEEHASLTASLQRGYRAVLSQVNKQ